MQKKKKQNTHTHTRTCTRVHVSYSKENVLQQLHMRRLSAGVVTVVVIVDDIVAAAATTTTTTSMTTRVASAAAVNLPQSIFYTCKNVHVLPFGQYCLVNEAKLQMTSQHFKKQITKQTKNYLSCSAFVVASEKKKQMCNSSACKMRNDELRVLPMSV